LIKSSRQFLSLFLIVLSILGPSLSSFFFAAWVIHKWIVLKPQRIIFFVSFVVESIKLVPKFSSVCFLLNSLSLWTVAQIFNVRTLQKWLWVGFKFLFNFVDVFYGLIIMLALHDCSITLFVHLFDCSPGVPIEIFDAWWYRIFNVNDFFLPEIFEITVFCSFNLFYVFLYFNLHLFDKIILYAM
jgi:hypothetical protein